MTCPDLDLVVARSALSDLVRRYAACADERDIPTLLSLFTSDARMQMPQPPDRLDPCRTLRGVAAIADELEALRGVAVTVHAIVGEVFDVAPDGSVASGRIACVAHHIIGERNLAWHLHYDDTYRHQPDGWRISHRALHIDFIETRPVKRHRLDQRALSTKPS